VPDEPETIRIRDYPTPPVKKLIEDFGCPIVEQDDLIRVIREEERRRKTVWSWIDKFVEEEAPQWANDQDTLVIEVPLANLAGLRCLNFTQQVWALQPSLFGYTPWGGRAFVRMWWDPEHSPMRALVQGYKRYNDMGGLTPRELEPYGAFRPSVKVLNLWAILTGVDFQLSLKRVDEVDTLGVVARLRRSC